MTELAAIVLAGGKSSRLGTDKVSLPHAGSTLLERMLSLADKFCDEVYVSGRNPREMGLDRPWIQDRHPGQGPIGGILTSLYSLQRPLLVLACDLPLLDKATIGHLLAARDAQPQKAAMTTYFQPATGFIEALVAVYEPSAAPLLQDALDQGIHKLSRAIPPTNRFHIPYTQEQSSVFFNINYPADLAMLKQVSHLEHA